MNLYVLFVSCIGRLIFQSKISPSLNIPDLHPKVTYCFSEGSAVSYHTAFTICDLWMCFWNGESGHTWHLVLCSLLQVLNGMSLCGLESFVKEQERLLCGPSGKETARHSCEQPGKDKRTSGKTHGTGWDYIFYHNGLVLVSFIHNVSRKCCIPCSSGESTCSNWASPLGCSKTPLSV